MALGPRPLLLGSPGHCRNMVISCTSSKWLTVLKWFVRAHFEAVFSAAGSCLFALLNDESPQYVFNVVVKDNVNNVMLGAASGVFCLDQPPQRTVCT